MQNLAIYCPRKKTQLLRNCREIQIGYIPHCIPQQQYTQIASDYQLQAEFEYLEQPKRQRRQKVDLQERERAAGVVMNQAKFEDDRTEQYKRWLKERVPLQLPHAVGGVDLTQTVRNMKCLAQLLAVNQFRIV